MDILSYISEKQIESSFQEHGVHELTGGDISAPTIVAFADNKYYYELNDYSDKCSCIWVKNVDRCKAVLILVTGQN